MPWVKDVSSSIFTVWLASLLLVASQVRNWGLTSAPVLVLLVLAACGLLAWILVERRSKGPLIGPTMMRGNIMWTTSASAALLGVILYGLQTFLPQFVQTTTATGYGLGLTVLQSGLVLVPMAAAIFVMGFASATLTHRLGIRTVLVAGPAIAALGLVFLLTTPVHLWQVLTASALSGIGIGLTLAAMPAIIIASVPPHQSGVAGGINANLRTVGGAFGAALVASIVAPTADQQPTAIAYQAGFTVIAGAAALAIITGTCAMRPAKQNKIQDKAEAPVH
ncbi:MFS transporter [Pseudarthrobacter phenanthrenivorans]|uniref:MFS transporter n=1 Tax=Pseudarthrobacter phenanthrenivorans TaxID=361575 RepID=UPI00344D5F36